VGQHDKLLDKNYYTKKISINNNLKKNDRLNSIIFQIIQKINLSAYESVIVQGDTATAFAISISAFNQKKRILYIESGLRSYDFLNPFPEEGYRQMISRIADINFAPTQLSKKNLISEGVKKKIIVTGNTSLDNLITAKKKSNYSNIILITLHRRENISILLDWFKVIDEMAKKFTNIDFVYPIHANPTIQKLKKNLNHINLIDHLDHNNLISYLNKSKLVITDSGGIQEEASFLNKKVIVCRKTTERPEGIKTGHLYLCKSPSHFKRLFLTLIKKYKINNKSPYGDGKSSQKIVSYLLNNQII
jgi:UDP-N-acetylglucosamine 2-epimerase (non-hydrolysing)